MGAARGRWSARGALLLLLLTVSSVGAARSDRPAGVERATADLASPQARVRKAAATSLAAIGTGAAAAAPALTRALLQDHDVGVRTAALAALVAVAPAAESTVETLLRVAHAEDPPLGEDAWVALERMGRGAVAALVRAYGDDALRYGAALLLERLGPGARAAAPMLEPRLEHAEAYERLLAAGVLSAIDPRRAAPATPELLRRLASRGEGSAYVAVVLGRIGTPAAIGGVVQALADLRHHRFDRAQFARVLADSCSRYALCALAAALSDDPDWLVREAAAGSLVRLGGALRSRCGARGATLAELWAWLAPALADPEWAVRREAAAGLGALKCAPALAHLERCLRDEHESVRLTALRSIRAIRGEREGEPPPRGPVPIPPE